MALAPLSLAELVQAVSALNGGSRWIGSTITYSIPGVSASWPGYAASAEPFSDQPLSAAQAAQFRLAIAAWDSIIAPDFVEVSDATPGTIRVAFTSFSEILNAYAYAYFPAAGAQAGDIWINAGNADETFDRGTFGFEALMHELGHAIGLKHPFENGTVLPANLDNTLFSIMSYTEPLASLRVVFSPTANGGIQWNGAQVQSISPAPLDILAAQAIYGVETDASPGNTVYSFLPDHIHFETINDSGGIDTISLSNQTRGSNIDLRAGAFSDVGFFSEAAQAATAKAAYASWAHSFIDSAFASVDAFTFSNNLAISYSTTIENAVGGAGNDRIGGNAVSNYLDGGGGADTIIGDGVVSWTYGAAAVRRLYLATLDRGPDDNGHRYWQDQLDAGQSLVSVAAGFVGSAEFQARYGALGNAAFVDLLYQNVLNRPADAPGSAYWTGLLNGGTSRASVVTGFSESSEFSFSTEVREHSGQVFRLYDTAFNRNPDGAGFQLWTDQRYSGLTTAEIAGSFMASPEFTARYGNVGALSNQQFVDILYQNVLDRPADPGGRDHWIGVLAYTSRQDVLIGFSESSEHRILTNTGLNGFLTSVFAQWTDTIVGSAGNDTLTGGHGSDLFVFGAGAGTDTVLGFESFDRLQFNGFGFGSAAQVLANTQQNGADAVFSAAGSTVVFQDTQLSTLQGFSSGWLFA